MSLYNGRLIVVAVLSLTLTACVPFNGVNYESEASLEKKLQLMSAGYTGCTPQTNKIINAVNDRNGGWWTVQCEEKRYLCSAGNDNDKGSNFSCALAVE